MEDNKALVLSNTSSQTNWNKEISIKDLRMEQIRNCLKLANTEKRGGFYNETIQIINGQPLTKREYVADTRAAYVDSVIALYDLILAENVSVGADEHLKKCHELIDEMEIIYKKYLQDVEDKEQVENERYQYISTKLRTAQMLFRNLMIVISFQTKGKGKQTGSFERNK